MPNPSSSLAAYWQGCTRFTPSGSQASTVNQSAKQARALQSKSCDAAPHLSGQLAGSEGDDHAGLQDAGLDTAHRHSADAADLVHILQRRQ